MVKWLAFRKEWGKKQGTKEAEITAVKISGARGKITDRFKCGQEVKIIAEFVVHEEVKEPHFGVAIFREDGTYCHGPNTFFDGYRIEKLRKGEGWFSIEYESLNLMPGEYRISVAIWDKKEFLAYSYHPGFYKIRILGRNKNGQLFYMPCQWKSQDKVSSKVPKEEEPDLRFLEDKWKKKFSSREVKITSVELLSKKGNLSDSFETGQDMEIRLKIKNKRDWLNEYLWVGIYREDNVYCYGTLKSLAKDEKIISLVYPKLQLLPGEYRISVGIWKPNQKAPLVCHHGIYPFEVFFERKDHGTIYMDHSWGWELP